MKKSFSKSSANSGNNKGKHANKHGRKYKEEDREDRGVDVACESVFRVAINPREVGDGSEGAKEADGTAGSGEEDCEDDVMLKEIIGDNWKVLCGAEQPVVKKGNSPGYDHSVHWPMSMSRYQDMICREQAARAAKLLEHSCYLDPATGSVTLASAWDFCAAANDFTNSLEFARILEQLAVAWGSMEDAIDEEELQSATSDQVAVDST
jgi:hypothetical protein